MRKFYTTAFILFAAPAFGQTQTYYGADGSYQGQSIQNGNTRTYYGPTGGYVGQSIDAGGSRTYYGPTGGYEGQSIRDDYR